MGPLQEKNRCVVTQRFYTDYRDPWGPHEVGGAEARLERLFK
jgi:hypothetical protein